MILGPTTVLAGKRYKVARPYLADVDSFEYPTDIVGLVGLCRWSSKDGVCLLITFPNERKIGFIVPYTCLTLAGRDPIKFRSIPKATELEFNLQLYRIAKLPEVTTWNVGLLGQVCSIITTTNGNKDVIVNINNSEQTFLLPLECLEYVGA